MWNIKSITIDKVTEEEMINEIAYYKEHGYKDLNPTLTLFLAKIFRFLCK